MSRFCSKYPNCGCVDIGTKCYDDFTLPNSDQEPERSVANPLNQGEDFCSQTSPSSNTQGSEHPDYNWLLQENERLRQTIDELYTDNKLLKKALSGKNYKGDNCKEESLNPVVKKLMQISSK